MFTGSHNKQNKKMMTITSSVRSSQEKTNDKLNDVNNQISDLNMYLEQGNAKKKFKGDPMYGEYGSDDTNEF